MSGTGDEQPLASGDPNGGEADPGWPWSFILLVVAGALYLVFRFVELIVKVVS
jgi:hypothetical protein